MNDQSKPPTPDASAIKERVKTAVHSHRIKLRWLTTAAFVFGFVAVAASIYIASFWLLMVPKQREMLHDTPMSWKEQAKIDNESAEDGVKRIDNSLRTEAGLTYIASTQATGAALAVAVLGLGTLSLLTVVILNRRVALNQINDSLVQISKQLRELQTERGST
ncbi:MAG: hypothetical protein ACLQU3_30740 [Limisphaerales bacterium]